MKYLLLWVIFVGFGLAWIPDRVQASVVSTPTNLAFSFNQGIKVVLLAQGSGSGSGGGGGGGGGMEKIKQALYSGGGDGVFDVGLGWLRGIVIFFLGIYGIYLGIALAFGQSDAAAIASFFFGCMMALGAQAVAGLYSVLFEKGGGG